MIDESGIRRRGAMRRAASSGAPRVASAGLLGGTAIVALTILTAGAAHAGTPDVNGKKYSDAQTTLKSAGFTAVVATTVGDQKAWPDCLVTNVVSRTVPPPANTSGSPVNQALVSLNCYGAEASANKSGYSVASAEGKAIAAEEKKAKTSSSS